MTTNPNTPDNGLEILTEQVGRLTEGLTEIKLLIQQQATTADRQAETARLQAESIARLIVLLER
jgi:hypothetical protein